MCSKVISKLLKNLAEEARGGDRKKEKSFYGQALTHCPQPGHFVFFCNDDGVIISIFKPWRRTDFKMAKLNKLLPYKTS